MLYVFVQGPDRNESCNVVGVFEGPDGLDVNKLYDQFFSQFDYRVFGGVVYPEYKGPTLTPTPFGAVASGSVHITAILPGGGSTAPDVGSPEYQKYLKACSKLRQEHQAKIDVRVAELRTDRKSVV